MLVGVLGAGLTQFTGPAEAVQWPAATGSPGAAGTPAVAAPEPKTRLGERERLRLILIDAEGLSPEAAGVLGREVGAILAGTGVDVDVGFAGEASLDSADASGVAVKVVLLSESGRRFGVGDDHMGAHLRVDGRPGDTVYVFVPVVREALGNRLQTARRRAELLLGRALGRVAAHEVVHAIAPDVPHASSGVMKSIPNMRDLVVAEVRLDAFSSTHFRQALERRNGTLAGR